MRPYRTFTKNSHGAVAYVPTRVGNVVAHLTTCVGGGTWRPSHHSGPISFVKGRPGKNKAEARDNLDKRLVQIAHSVLSKRTDAQLRAYLKRIGFVTTGSGLRFLYTNGYGFSQGYYVIHCDNGLDKVRFYAKRILRAHKASKAVQSKSTPLKKAA
jgi:hypothetical protein